jgi:uncharacterized membrane protein HdeD (DUF308 family)
MQTSTGDLQAAMARPMLHELAKNWWLILLRGICAIIFGVLTFVWPGVTLVTLVLLYGAFALADGIFALGAAIAGRTPEPRWWLALVGLIGIAAGIVTLLWPGMTAVILLFFIAAWAIASGVMQIVGAIRLRKEISDEWLLIASGVLSVLFGLVLLARPGLGALSMIFVIGAFAIAYGILEVMFSLRLRRHVHA